MGHMYTLIHMSPGTPAIAQGKAYSCKPPPPRSTFSLLGENQYITPALPGPSGLLDSTASYVIFSYALHWLKLLASQVQHGSSFHPTLIAISTKGDKALAMSAPSCGRRPQSPHLPFVVGPSGVATLVHAPPAGGPQLSTQDASGNNPYKPIPAPKLVELRGQIQSHCSGAEATRCPVLTQLNCLAYVLHTLKSPQLKLAYNQTALPPVVLYDATSPRCIPAAAAAAGNLSALGVPYAITNLTKAEATPLDVQVTGLLSATRGRPITNLQHPHDQGCPSDSSKKCVTFQTCTARASLSARPEQPADWAWRPDPIAATAIADAATDAARPDAPSEGANELLRGAHKVGQCYVIPSGSRMQYVSESGTLTSLGPAETVGLSAKDFASQIAGIDTVPNDPAERPTCPSPLPSDANCFLTGVISHVSQPKPVHGATGPVLAPPKASTGPVLGATGPVVGATGPDEAKRDFEKQLGGGTEAFTGPSDTTAGSQPLPLPAFTGTVGQPVQPGEYLPDHPGAVGIVGTDGIAYNLSGSNTTMMEALGAAAPSMADVRLLHNGQFASKQDAMKGLRVESNGSYYTIPCKGTKVTSTGLLCETKPGGSDFDACLSQAAHLGSSVVGMSVGRDGCTVAYKKAAAGDVIQKDRLELITGINLAQSGTSGDDGTSGTYLNAPLPSPVSNSHLQGLMSPHASAGSGEIYNNAFGSSAHVRHSLSDPSGQAITPPSPILPAVIDQVQQQLEQRHTHLTQTVGVHQQNFNEVGERLSANEDALQAAAQRALRAQIEQSDLLVRMTNMETGSTRTSAMAEDAHLKMLTRSYAYFGWGALALVLAVGVVRAKAG